MKKLIAIFVLCITPILLIAASTQIDWTQIKNKPSFWNDPGAGTLLKRTGAFTFASAVAGDLTTLLGYTPENTANKGAASGYAPLNVSSQVPAANLPPAWNDPGSGTLLKRTGAFTFAAASNTDVNSVIGFTPENSANKGAVSGYAGLNGSSVVPTANLPACVASGASHAAGLVPDPGASAGTTHFLREDCTWVVPSTSTKPNFTWGCNGAVTAATTLYLQARNVSGCTNVSLTESSQVATAVSTLSPLYVVLSNASAVHNIVVTVLLNNSTVTAITCTIAPAATSCNDTTHTASTSAGDVVQLRYVTLAGETANGVLASLGYQ